MPKLWKFSSKAEAEAPRVEKYQFLPAEPLGSGAADKMLEPDEAAADSEYPMEAEETAPQPTREHESDESVSYAQLQSEIIMQDARCRAEELLRQAEEQAAQEAEAIRTQAEKEGYEAGFRKGTEDGSVKALEEGTRARQELAKRLEDEVEAFLKKAERAVEQQLDDNIDELRDLALAVAEKVICVSLKSSSDVIWRMIQTAIDKRRRREWVHIYIAECDVGRRTTLPPALTTALSELSDRVRITPMADDESGTCIIELPDEIIDASASTQLQNIREVLGNGSGHGTVTSFHYREK